VMVLAPKKIEKAVAKPKDKVARPVEKTEEKVVATE